MPDKYLTTKDLESKYQVSKGTLAKWRKAGMPFMKVSGTYRYVESDVDQWFRDFSETKNEGEN